MKTTPELKTFKNPTFAHILFGNHESAFAVLKTRFLPRRKSPRRKISWGDVGWNLLCSQPFPAVPAGRRLQSAATWLGDIFGRRWGEEGRTHNFPAGTKKPDLCANCSPYSQGSKARGRDHATCLLPTVILLRIRAAARPAHRQQQ